MGSGPASRLLRSLCAAPSSPYTATQREAASVSRQQWLGAQRGVKGFSTWGRGCVAYVSLVTSR